MIDTLLKSLIKPIVGNVIDLIPDRRGQAKAKRELERAVFEAANTAQVAQLEINKREAMHRTVWVAGWRPLFGWTCGTGLALSWVVFPLIYWVLDIAGFAVRPPPELPTEAMAGMITTISGLGVLRSWEKKKGITK